MLLTHAPPLQLRELMAIAEDRDASDLHLAAGHPPTLRIDGRIVTLEEPPMEADTLRGMIGTLVGAREMARLARRRVLEFSEEVPGLGRFRVSVFYARGCLAASFRRVPELRPADDLGLPHMVKELAAMKDGLVLIAGAVGTGKTTTLNHILDLINSSRCVRILTVEDPVEYVHQSKSSTVLQLEVGEDTRSFAHALKSCFRQDPNVIAVGEMRDLKTVSMALQAAETGHLVLSTLHTPTATATVNRIINVFPPHQQSQARLQLTSVLRGVICQKLLRRARGPGRVLAYEVMLANQAIRRLIRDGKEDQIPNLLAVGKDRGMISMDHCLVNLVGARAISWETAMRHCQDPDALKGMEPADEREV